MHCVYWTGQELDEVAEFAKENNIKYTFECGKVSLFSNVNNKYIPVHINNRNYLLNKIF